MSATGTYTPSTWHEDWPNWILAMSGMAGCSTQPESVVRWRMSTGAPQWAHETPAPSLGMWHHEHVSDVDVSLMSRCGGAYTWIGCRGGPVRSCGRGRGPGDRTCSSSVF